MDGGVMEYARGVISFEQHRAWGLGAVVGSQVNVVNPNSNSSVSFHTFTCRTS